MSSRLNNKKTGARVIIMQRVHERDLSGHVLEKGNYEHLILPARWDGPQKTMSFSDPRTHMGELLWPDRLDEKDLSELEIDMGEYASAGQLQQRPSPREGCIIKKQWWRFWQYPGDNYPTEKVILTDGTVLECEVIDLPMDIKTGELHPTLVMNQSWDMTFKETTGTDFVCGGVWGKWRANAYLLDCVHKRMDFPSTVKAVHKLKREWPRTKRIWVEDKANGPAVISTLKNIIPGLIAVNPEGDKTARVAAVTYVIESGNVILPHPKIAPWVRNMIKECGAFPNATHDDYVDMLAQALRKMFGAGGVKLGAQAHYYEGYMNP
jgi:predicted phage terminase large subunit-like protein